MPPAHRLTDLCTGHGPCPPRPIIEGSPDVFTNNLNQTRMGDNYAIHCLHGGVLVSDSPDVYTNNRQTGRVTDPVSCGSNAMTGSPDVFING
jgi:uncharacterized Zn-binding protein involved in type VI secretion